MEPLETGHYVGVETDMAHDSDEEWMSFDTAGQMLGVSSWTVRFRLERGDLQMAENSADELGVTRASVVDEQQWQATASFGRRTWRGTRYAASWLLEILTR